MPSSRREPDNAEAMSTCPCLVFETRTGQTRNHPSIVPPNKSSRLVFQAPEQYRQPRVACLYFWLALSLSSRSQTFSNSLTKLLFQEGAGFLLLNFLGAQLPPHS